MGVYTFTIVDHITPVAPTRLLKALCLDNHNCLPKVVPQLVKSAEFLEGDSTSVGCVKVFNFTEVSPFKYVKTKIDELDVDKCYVKYSSFEGDACGDKLEYIVYEAKAEPSGTGSHYTMLGHHHSKGDAVLTEEDVGLQGMKAIYGAVEEYLRNNPEAYA